MKTGVCAFHNDRGAEGEGQIGKQRELFSIAAIAVSRWMRMTQHVHVASRQDPNLLLTGRMVEILRQIAAGGKASEISKALGIAVDTVYKHAADMRRRLGARNDADLVRLAIYHGFIDASNVDRNGPLERRVPQDVLGGTPSSGGGASEWFVVASGNKGRRPPRRGAG
jgi:DNA-binding CsgD family transcriptional regulator